ncbi:hypothetical protein [Sulfurimonas sp.]|uniref:hypothetical protein n=1 Tax=Sulfurimonas sp. TaxID=2022749 RepID=UPI002B48B57D|nr:hypothetical protein [Sulfurimonas sp.]
MSNKSLRKSIKRQKVDKVTTRNLHLVAGKHEHTHSVAPISASEIEKLESINPEYVDRLFSIMEKSVDVEEKEVSMYFEAVAREQENDELSIYAQNELSKKAIHYSTALVVFLILSAISFAYIDLEYISLALVSTVIGVVVKAIMKDNSKTEPDK